MGANNPVEQKTEGKFANRSASQPDESRYFRFNIQQGLQDVGLAEHKDRGKIEIVTDEYLRRPKEKIEVRDCVKNLKTKTCTSTEDFS
ncbi:hypothetical protein VTN00DRAFT_8433 [Thermoascus crustaceus]|uniref:uncharacterized protein n=1 Tax=Thermoascus crustaceus TaxID=5088 RepID=UPI0037430977